MLHNFTSYMQNLYYYRLIQIIRMNNFHFLIKLSGKTFFIIGFSLMKYITLWGDLGEPFIC